MTLSMLKNVELSYFFEEGKTKLTLTPTVKMIWFANVSGDARTEFETETNEHVNRF